MAHWNSMGTGGSGTDRGQNENRNYESEAYPTSEDGTQKDRLSGPKRRDFSFAPLP
jgi:hypothetical protein